MDDGDSTAGREHDRVQWDARRATVRSATARLAPASSRRRAPGRIPPAWSRSSNAVSGIGRLPAISVSPGVEIHRASISRIGASSSTISTVLMRSASLRFLGACVRSRCNDRLSGDFAEVCQHIAWRAALVYRSTALRHSPCSPWHAPRPGPERSSISCSTSRISSGLVRYATAPEPSAGAPAPPSRPRSGPPPECRAAAASCQRRWSTSSPRHVGQMQIEKDQIGPLATARSQARPDRPRRAAGGRPGRRSSTRSISRTFERLSSM